MPVAFDAARRVVIVTALGRVTGHQIADTLQAVYNDPNWQSGYDVIWDGSGITELVMEPPDIPALVALQRDLAPRAGQGRDVIIAHRAIDDMMAQIYIMAARSVRPAQLARSLSEAFRILASGRDT
jgi:hypothetical protein